MEQRQDLVLGLFFAALGLAAAWIARSYTGAGGTYPLILGLVLTFLGVIIAVRAARSASHETRELMTAPVNLLLAVVACVAYVACVVPLGFYTASALLLLLLPVLLGFRQPVYLGMMALVFMTIVWLLFSVVLEKPLPAEIWSTIRTEQN